MFEEHTITELIREEKESKKTGKPYERLLIHTDLNGPTQLSGFGSAETREWKVGDKVRIKVSESRSLDGKRTYYNFEYPRKPNIETRVGILEIGMDAIMRKLEMKVEPKPTTPSVKAQPQVEYPAEEINIEDIPF